MLIAPSWRIWLAQGVLTVRKSTPKDMERRDSKIIKKQHQSTHLPFPLFPAGLKNPVIYSIEQYAQAKERGNKD